MPSYARSGSAPRPSAPPHQGASPEGAAQPDAAHGGSAHGGSSYGHPPYGGDVFTVEDHGSTPWDALAEGAHTDRASADRVSADGHWADGPYSGGASASGYGGRRQGGGDHGSVGEGERGVPHAVGGSVPRGASRHNSGGSPRPTRAQARAAVRARARRKRLKRTGFLGVGSVAAVAVIALAGFMNPHHDSSAATQADSSAVPVAGRTGNGDASRSVDRPTPAAAISQLPGLGAAFLAKVPADAQQVLLVTGAGKSQNTGTAVLYTRTAAGTWLPGPTWAARNAKNGWTTDHHAGDLHSPIGVFSLTDAGGLDANPGTKLPYTHSSEFQAPGTGFEGESLADAFDYVVAINYNHVPGTSPLSPERPMGAARGGGIWVHVDHGGPTHGCVALAKADIRALLLALDPSKHPVIVMGDAATLAQ